MTKPSLFADIHTERVISIEHYTDQLFSFRATRPRSFRFRSGEFVMISLPDMEKRIFRAYSIASPSWDNELEFLSVKVVDGLLTPRLSRIQPGDSILLRAKTTGMLVLDSLTPGKRLFMISSGTGIAPFASLLRDPETYGKFNRIILAQTCRTSVELAYGQKLMKALPNDPLVGEHVSGRVLFYFSTTREPGLHTGRITELIQKGKFHSDLGIETFNPEFDRMMICGSIHMLEDMKNILKDLGFEEGSLRQPGSFTIERAFVGY